MDTVNLPSPKPRIPAVDGWFTLDGENGPALIGSRCQQCGTYAFPKQTRFCPNPACASTAFDEVELSRTGRLWSFTNNCYQPPAPYVPPSGGFQPFGIAAVELAAERLVVLGQLTPGVELSDLWVGQEVELVIDTLFEDDEAEYVVWKWQPLAQEDEPATLLSIDPYAISGDAIPEEEWEDLQAEIEYERGDDEWTLEWLIARRRERESEKSDNEDVHDRNDDE